ncbi:DUF1697 domain-containing protein [Poseidonocella sp. HB161398]|uniref:DUF1697 domain-containing protein n=1 Tax=Poseidonocella sp. HB161398 TaxID=2320855 RepID=UPI0011097BC7|nr:DUF1697 domain-containing protein [Poseidonocella sp. HB161398]
MTRYAALLRAVNVGGTGKLPMTDLRALCRKAGFADVATYIQSGNAVFRTELEAAEAQAALEAELQAALGQPVGVFLRDSLALGKILAENPFPGAPPAQVAVLFLAGAPAPDPASRARGQTDEEIVAGASELYIRYPSGMGRSRLKLPEMAEGTARNLRTVAKLADMLAAD